MKDDGFYDTETLIPSHGLRWNNGVLEQRYTKTNGYTEVWKPVPVVPRNPEWAAPVDACIHCKCKPCACAVAQSAS